MIAAKEAKNLAPETAWQLFKLHPVGTRWPIILASGAPNRLFFP